MALAFTPGSNLDPALLSLYREGLSNASAFSSQPTSEGANQSPPNFSSPYYDPQTDSLILPGMQSLGGGIAVIPNAGQYLNGYSQRASLNGMPQFNYDRSGQLISQTAASGFHNGDDSLTDFGIGAAFMVPAFAATAAGVAGAAGAAGATGATTAPVLGSTGAIGGTELGMLGATGAGGAAAAAGGGAAAAAGGGLGGWGAALLAPAASLVGGALTANAAGNAADTMAGAAQSGIDETRRQFDTVRQLLQPYVSAGNTSLTQYQNLSGANGPDAQRAAMAALEGSPQFASLTKAGENAILQNASATGGLRGGNVQGALFDKRAAILNGLAQQQLGNYLPIVQGGQNAAAGTGNAAIQTGANVANLYGQQGAASAGGIVAGTNAITNSLGNVAGFFAGQGAASAGGVPYPNAAPVNLTNGFGSGVVQGYSNGGNLF